jgi:amino acid transporter
MKSQLQRSMGLADVALFFIIAAANLQWIGASAAAGPSSLFAWGFGCLVMFVPLCIVVVYLSAKYPREGGMYVWSTRAFGAFPGFITAWTYWCSVVAYLPALLYFTAGSALYIVGGSGTQGGSPAYFIAFALLGVLVGTGLNVLGLEVGKWLVNVAAICRTLVILLLLALGAIGWAKYGFATPLTAMSLRPTFDLKELIFLSVIALAFTGPEALPFMAEEVRDPKRSIPLGLAIAAPAIVAIYVLGTLGLFALISPEKTDSLYGVMQGIEIAAGRFGGPYLVPVAATLITVSCLGSLTAWMGANARLPFVAGIDHYLPASFGWLHPRWHSPVVSLLVQGAVAAVLVVLGQSGTSVKGAYDVLVSAMILATMVPFILMFASGIKLSERKLLIVIAGIVGTCTVTGAMILSAFPAPDDPSPALAVIKVVGANIVMVLVGAAFFLARRKKATLEAASVVAVLILAFALSAVPASAATACNGDTFTSRETGTVPLSMEHLQTSRASSGHRARGSMEVKFCSRSAEQSVAQLASRNAVLGKIEIRTPRGQTYVLTNAAIGHASRGLFTIDFETIQITQSK